MNYERFSHLLMTFKKRYLLVLFFIFWMLFAHSNVLTMRTSNEQQKTVFEAKGIEDFSFQNYSVDGRKMNYLQVGKDDSQNLVLMAHGSPGSLDAYMDYLTDKTLSENALLIAVDRTGFGYSDFGNAERSLQSQALQLKPILEKYADRNIILVGHSYGGPLIARMAMDYGEWVDALVMVAPSISPELEPQEWWRKPLDWWGIRSLIPPAFRVCNQEILPLKKELEKMLPLWRDIQCPVTVLQGMEDTLVPKGNADFAKQMLVNSSKVDIQMMEGDGHFILWSKMDVVKKVVKGYLKDLKF
ncbi:MAG: alpha/beta fold hydrolase [Chitinophagales bacterium]